jgi:hypothetical protein
VVSVAVLVSSSRRLVSSDKRLSTRQCARLLSEWIARIGLDPSLFGTHSLRRTKATLIYRRTGNLRAVQLSWNGPQKTGHEHTESSALVSLQGADMHPSAVTKPCFG